jgi:hypothetical protein
MTRKTSIEAYRRMQEDGTLSQNRWEVYEVLFHHGPMTALEIHAHVPNQTPNDIGSRLNELDMWGVAKETGATKINATGNKANLWDVTDQVGVPPPKDPRAVPKPTREEARKAIDDIRASFIDETPNEAAKLLAWVEYKFL